MLYSFFLSTGIVDRFLIYSYGLYKLGMFDTAGGDFWLRMPLVRHLWLTVNVKKGKELLCFKIIILMI